MKAIAVTVLAIAALMTAPRSAADPPGIGPFTGSWHAHASGLTIAGDGSGRLTYADIKACPSGCGGHSSQMARPAPLRRRPGSPGAQGNWCWKETAGTVEGARTTSRSSTVCVGVVGFLALAMMVALDDRSPHQRPGAAPTVTVTTPANNALEHSMNPTPVHGIPGASASHPTRPARPAAPVRTSRPAIDGTVTFVVTAVDRSKTVANPSFPFMQSKPGLPATLAADTGRNSVGIFSSAR